MKNSGNVVKLKELWKSLGMPKKTVASNFNIIVNNKSLTYGIKTMSKVFKHFSSNFAESLLVKLPDRPNMYTIFLYYSNFEIPREFGIRRKKFKVMENTEIHQHKRTPWKISKRWR